MTQGNELSFLPDGYLARKSGRRALVIGVTLIVIVGALVTLASVRVERTIVELESRDRMATNEYSRAVRTFERETQNRDQHRRAIERATMAAGLIESVPRSNMLAELTNALPKGGSLLDVTLDAVPHMDPVASTGSSFDMRKATQDAKHQLEQVAVPTPPTIDVTMHLTGLAGSDREVAQYLANLGASPLFKDVNLVISEAYIAAGPKAANIRRFQIQLALKSDGNVELPIRSNAQSTAALVE